MSRLAFSAALTMLVLAAGNAHAAAIQDPNMVVLPDPDLSKAARFPAGAATAGEARIGQALDKADVHGCSARNPCAVTEPAGPDAAMAAPRQHTGERRRQPG